MISIFQAPIRNITPYKTVSLSDIAKVIKSTKYKAVTEKLRSLPKEEASKCKSNDLDYATFSGTFSKRSDSAIIAHSGKFTIDIDHVGSEADIKAIQARIQSLIQPDMMFISPSGDGLKIVLSIDINEGTQSQYYHAFEVFFRQEFNIEIDKACKDVSRATFLCHDANVIVNEKPTLFGKWFLDIYKNVKKELPTPTTEILTDESAIIENLKKWIDKSQSFVEGNRNRYITELAASYNRYGISESAALNYLLQYSQTDFPDSEIKATIRSIYANTTLHGTSSFEATTRPVMKPNKQPLPTTDKGLFTVLTASQWIEQAKVRPIPKMLFDSFWFEGELCILFADTNLGKSILAVQIANSLSNGMYIPGFKLEAEKQRIIYFDFELSDKQFEVRYSDSYTNHYPFSSCFFRAEINPESSMPDAYDSFETYLNQSLEKTIIETGAKILIIDNLTYLKSATETAKDALPLMKHLKALKAKYGLSILALAHTPKRDLSKPITRNDLQGSKMLINFCDSAFSIGESSTDKSIRYLKQIKARNCEIYFDSENVITCQISKPVNFLQFEFLSFGSERLHLREQTEKDRENIIEKVSELKRLGKSLREIGVELGISHMKVSRIIKEL